MPDGTGNTEMVRVIAEQLFATWKSEQQREARETRRWFGGNVGGWVAVLVVVVTGIAAGSDLYKLANDANARSIDNERAIVQMRVSNSDRLARIETKLDRILEERK